MGQLHTFAQAAGMIRSVERCASIKHDHIGGLLTVVGLAPAEGIVDQRQ